MTEPETITLHNVAGVSRKSGTDEHDLQWIQYELDPFCMDDLTQLDECCLCGAAIASGWLCLDDGDVCCDEHVAYED